MKSSFMLKTLSMLVIGLMLAACSSAQASDLLATPGLTIVPFTPAPGNSSEDTSDSSSSKNVAPWPDGEARQDFQGAVEVSITPLNLNDAGNTLDFEVSLNTHSIDLEMDLAALATLTTDTGLTVQASRWDAPRRGHHLSGVLSFPSSISGIPVLEGATRLTLTLINLDATQRIFIWER